MGQIKVEKNVGGIEGLCVIEPAVHGDARGYFMETYNEKDMKEAGIDIHFVQDNQSMSTKGVLRGLHFQKQYPQCKLVRAVRGTVFDVAVDLRSDSETYGKWYGVTLSAENKKQFLIPEGFAHGFLVLSDEAEFCYKVNDFWHFYKEIHKLGGTVFLNPDGHEWMRAKWSAPIRKYWKISEQMMVKYCDLAICDSVNIEKYIHECYDGKGIKGRNPKTTFIAYGADLTLSKLDDDDEKLVNWYKEKGLTKKGYYLVVGRFVPENSFEVMIREFMKSESKRDFALITNVNDKFLNELEEKLHFKGDKRIKFVGTVYDQELLKKIRENAYAYFHGHTVGGTNPSLIEALGSTDLNLLVDVGFNKEVAEDCALYWSREPGSLANLIDKSDRMNSDEIVEMGRRAKKRVADEYTWDKICRQYEEVFIK